MNKIDLQGYKYLLCWVNGGVSLAEILRPHEIAEKIGHSDFTGSRRFKIYCIDTWGCVEQLTWNYDDPCGIVVYDKSDNFVFSASWEEH